MKGQAYSTKLASGREMPLLGIGTWMLSGKACQQSVKDALSMGYNHIDTADYYRNHRDVAAGMKDFSRQDIFLTTKVWFTDLRAQSIDKACHRFLKELGTSYLDLLLVHWPNDKVPIKETMGALGKLVSEDLVRNIGVSNFDERRLSAALSASKVPISVNQVEFHPHLYQKELLSFCQEKGVALTAYCPLGRGNIVSDPLISGIARSVSKTPAQVALRWLIQHGITVIPKATSEAHIRENMEIFSWKLSKDNMEAIDALGATERLVNPAFTGNPLFDAIGSKISRTLGVGLVKSKPGKGFFDKKHVKLKSK